MEISRTSSSSYLQQLQEYEELQRERMLQQQESSGQNVDAYIPSNVTGDETLCSDNYNDIFTQMLSKTEEQSGTTQPMMAQMMPLMPPQMEKTDATDETEETDETTDTDSTQAILDEVSSTMRVGQDAILQTLEELGLSTTDLYDSSNMEKLVNALNDKAGALGLPTVDSVEDSLSVLTEYMSEHAQEV